MSAVYADSCILVKLLVPEPDSLAFDQRLSGEVLESSELALAEVPSALLAKERMGSLSPPRRLAAVAEFANLLEEGGVHLIRLDRSLIERACRMQAACHPQVALRTLDALHLASCERAGSTLLATTDARMQAAARHFGIPLLAL
jgi:predicted nucleic acid-binding protein